MKFNNLSFLSKILSRIAECIVNSADCDQTAPKKQSDQSLHCLPKDCRLLI